MELVIFNKDRDFYIQLLMFIKKMYSIYGNESYILSEDDLRKLTKENSFLKKKSIFSNDDTLIEILFRKSRYDENWVDPQLENGIYGLSSGIYITLEYVTFLFENRSNEKINLRNINSDFERYFTEDSINTGKFIKQITKKEIDFLRELFTGCSYLIEENRLFQYQLEKQKVEERNNSKKLEKLKLEETKLSIILDLDKDNNGQVDLVDGESFNKLLNKNQKSIIEIDKNYIQKFVKISMYLKTKKSNTQKIFDSIKDTKNDKELNELVNLLKNQIHTYDILVFHSISMITSLVESDLITFYEIYECFDQLGVFNSNWENEVSNKLTDIGDGIKDLMYSIYQMENKIVNSISNLTYVTQDSFKELNISVNNQLNSIDSSIKFNNLLTGIQTYQMYKINKNINR
jgi:hypothetical protein